jgi:hypothetical protein
LWTALMGSVPVLMKSGDPPTIPHALLLLLDTILFSYTMRIYPSVSAPVVL